MPIDARLHMTFAFHSPNQNQLLAALPSAEFNLLERHLELVPLALGEMLYEPHQQMRHAIFPTSAVVSLHYVTISGAAAEIAGVGHEGVVGIQLFMGGDTMPSSAVVQTTGHAYRLDRHLFKQAFERPGLMQGLLLRYTQALIAQVSQTAACNRHHSVEQQLSRWLLLTLDRAPGRELVMTQELVANMLGVRRESVTDAAGKLQQFGFIRYRRGHITVVDRQGLEARACECYGVVKKELARLLCDVRYRQEVAPTFRTAV
ncbi:MAG TPA: Crp/Fnr family transcriptional regulator [Xanthomonadales bacterium]|nr:Crp/Fnr family transcriptional regulator [Xanthomonadales bacterium]